MNEARFIELALTNGVNREILERLPRLIILTAEQVSWEPASSSVLDTTLMVPTLYAQN